MITWLFWVDVWEFPVSVENRSIWRSTTSKILVESSKKSDDAERALTETEAEKQLRWHHERWDYRDPSRYTFIPDQVMPLNNQEIPQWDPPERDYETWERTRPDYYDDYYETTRSDQPPWADEFPWQDMNYGL